MLIQLDWFKQPVAGHYFEYYIHVHLLGTDKSSSYQFTRLVSNLVVINLVGYSYKSSSYQFTRLVINLVVINLVGYSYKSSSYQFTRL